MAKLAEPITLLVPETVSSHTTWSNLRNSGLVIGLRIYRAPECWLCHTRSTNKTVRAQSRHSGDRRGADGRNLPSGRLHRLKT